MNVTDAIQLAILIVLVSTFILLLRQLVLQNRLLSAQVLRDRFEMYWEMYEPVTDQEVSELQLFPDDYLDEERYETIYRGEPKKIRKYIGCLQLYEYLAFCFALRELKLPDPLGYDWTERWTRELCEEPEFVHAHEYHKHYYPNFAAFVDSELANTLGENDA